MVKHAAMNIRVLVLPYIFSFLLGIYLGLKLLHSVVSLYLTFGEIAQLFSKMAAPLFISTATYEVSGFSTSSPTRFNVLLIEYRHPSKWEVVSHGGFDMHFPTD